MARLFAVHHFSLYRPHHTAVQAKKQVQLVLNKLILRFRHLKRSNAKRKNKSPTHAELCCRVDLNPYRNKIGLDVALEAQRDGWAQRKLTMDEIWHFATVDRVANVMRPYLESVTT